MFGNKSLKPVCGLQNSLGEWTIGYVGCHEHQSRTSSHRKYRKLSVKQGSVLHDCILEVNELVYRPALATDK